MLNFGKFQYLPITFTLVDIADDCIGDRWEINNEDELARIVGLIAKCQFGHAQSILHGIHVDTIDYPPEIEAEIKQDVISALTVPVDGNGKEERGTPKWHRDGFLFEAISWLVARKAHGPEVLMRDPHIGSTTQGLDGLMIQLNDAKDQVIKTTVFEDKCTEDARGTFRDKTLPALQVHHAHNRKILESANTLLRQTLPANLISKVAARAIQLDVRQYRASLTILPAEDSQIGRARIFKDYGTLAGLQRTDRIGCTFLSAGDVREWFEQFAKKVINSL